MSSRRGVILGLVLSALIVASSQAADLTVGSLGPLDRLVQSATSVVAAKAQQVVTADKTFTTPGGETIAQVKLLDQVGGATATVAAGGPGSKFVTAHFKSQRGRGINFLVQIYGH